MKEQFLERIEQRSAVIGILGLGYVGLPLYNRFAEVGFRVVGFDVDPHKIALLNSGKSYIGHIGDDQVAQALTQGATATCDFSRIGEVDAIIICVPTPLGAYKEPDLSFVVDTIKACTPYLRPGQLISLESTTYPGTTDEEMLTRVTACGFTAGKDLFVVYSPEREDPGNPDFRTQTIPKVCGGVTPSCLEAGVALYRTIIDTVVPVSSTRAAEMTKLLENIHRAVNIGLVNELKIVADRMHIDIHEVIDAAATKPFGFTAYYPGPGLGGHCIPIDPFYLTWKAREYGVHTRFIELAGEVNSSMPDWVIGKIAEALNGQRKAINGSRILILGIAYKKNVDDMRESPAAEIIERLIERGAEIDYSDPHVPLFPPMRNYRFDMLSQPLNAQMLSSYDCVVVVTDHSAFDYPLIRDHAKLVVDTRGVYREPAGHIIKA